MDLIIHRPLAGQADILLTSFALGTTTEKAEQKKVLMGVDTVTLSVKSKTPIDFPLGCLTSVFGELYTLNSKPKETEEGAFMKYDLVLEGSLYELRDAQLRDRDVSGFAISGTFDFQCTMKQLGNLIITNVNYALGSETWHFDEASCPETTTVLKSFDCENCLAVLQKACQEWILEFRITQQSILGVNHKTLFIALKVGSELNYTFNSGAGKGLYAFTKEYVESSNFTRLYVEGSEKNIPTNYRNYSRRLKLPSLYGAESKLELPGVTKHIEATKRFDDIFPTLESTVTSVQSLQRFGDSSINFDLNAVDETGNPLYLISGSSAKIHFNTGKLAGYEFEVSNFNFAQKTFDILQYKDARGLIFPMEGNSEFQIHVEDKYTLIDVIMPPTFIAAAEEKLLTQAQLYFDLGTKVHAKFSVSIFELFLKSFTGVTNFFNVGDSVIIQSARCNVDARIRIMDFTRDLISPLRYSLSLSDTVTVSLAAELLSASTATSKTVAASGINNIAKQRRNWKATNELTTMYDALKAEVALIGSDPAAQFQFSASVYFKANAGGDSNAFEAGAGALAHSVYPRTWNLSALSTASLNPVIPYYVYARVNVADSNGIYWLSATVLEVESNSLYYYFPIGLLSSVIDGTRSFQTAKGFTLISGDDITTGTIHDENDKLRIDLDNAKITAQNGATIEGHIKFIATDGTYKTVVEAVAEVAESAGAVNLFSASEIEQGTLATTMQVTVDSEFIKCSENYYTSDKI